MRAQQGCWQRVAGCLLAVWLCGVSGCMSFFHLVDAPKPELAGPCQELPACCRNHVYVFLIHGMDPLDYANLGGLNKYLHQLGFNNTYYGQLYHTHYFNREIRRIHQEDADARFVLIGFSFGANMVRSLAQDVKDEGIAIDLLVYLGGNTLDNIPEDRPENAERIVNILASGCIWNGAWLDGAINLHEVDVWHFGSPTHPKTLELLSEELTTIAGSVPVEQAAPPKAMPEADDAPTPRPVQMPRAAVQDEWDFLKPMPHLQLTTAPGATATEKVAQKQTVAARP